MARGAALAEDRRGRPCGFTGAETWALWQSSLGARCFAEPLGRKGRMPRVAANLPPLIVDFISRGAGDWVQKSLISGRPRSTGNGVCLREHVCVYVYSAFSVMIYAGKRARRSIKKICIGTIISRPASGE